MYIRPWPTQVEAHSLRRPWVKQLRMALDPTSEPTPWCVPALITSATSGDKLPFTVVRLALSLVQYGRTLRLWPGQNTTEGDRCKVGSRPAVPLRSIPPATRFNSRLSRNVYPALAHPSGGSQLKETLGQSVENGPRSHQRAHPVVCSCPDNKCHFR
jgi:hypothetical protein